MSEKRKSTPQAKVLTVVLLILFLGACAVLVFAVCSDIWGINNNTVPSTDASTEISVTSATEAASTAEPTAEKTSAATEASESQGAYPVLGAAYDVDYWAEYMDLHGSAGLGVLFGAQTRGATINFEDGRFVVNVSSADQGFEATSGSYSFISETEIELRYDNSDIKTAKVIEAEDGLITCLDFPMDIEDTTLRASIIR